MNTSDNSTQADSAQSDNSGHDERQEHEDRTASMSNESDDAQEQQDTDNGRFVTLDDRPREEKRRHKHNNTGVGRIETHERDRDARHHQRNASTSGTAAKFTTRTRIEADVEVDVAREHAGSQRFTAPNSKASAILSSSSGSAAMMESSKKNHAVEVVVCMATSKIGRKIVEMLLQNNFKVTAMTRNPTCPMAVSLERQGARLVKADMTKYDDMVYALKGVHTVISMQPTCSNETEMGHNVVHAAAECKVKNFIQISMMGANPNSPRKRLRKKAAVNDKVRDMGEIPHTIIHTAPLMEQFGVGGVHEPVNREIEFFVSDKLKIPYICTEDIAQVALHVVKEVPKQGHEMNIWGELLTRTNIANHLGKKSFKVETSRVKPRLPSVRETEALEKLAQEIEDKKPLADERPPGAPRPVKFKEWAQDTLPENFVGLTKRWYQVKANRDKHTM